MLIAWEEPVDPRTGEGQLGGGTHLLKITRTLEYLKKMGPEHDKDIVLMMDGYDVWFQLRKSLLLQRYYQINQDANARIKKHMGRAQGSIKQTVIFGAGKRCFPNQLHTMACWAIPESPLPKDIWYGNTDSVIGSPWNMWHNTRQKFLNSGFIMGPMADLRDIFVRANERVAELGEGPEEADNGGGSSERIYGGSDQSIFNSIFGEQEYQREAQRLRSLSWLFTPVQKLQLLGGKDIAATNDTLEGNPIISKLNPPWTHQAPDPLEVPKKQYEFGIGLDYWSMLTFQTANAESDGRWLNHSQPLRPQVGRQGRWDCKPRLEPISTDIQNGPPPFPADNSSLSRNASNWETLPLYTNICLGTIPVLLHHNGDKSARNTTWEDMWYQKYGVAWLAKQLDERQVFHPQSGNAVTVPPVGAFTDKGPHIGADQICGDWDLT